MTNAVKWEVWKLLSGQYYSVHLPFANTYWEKSKGLRVSSGWKSRELHPYSKVGLRALLLNVPCSIRVQHCSTAVAGCSVTSRSYIGNSSVWECVCVCWGLWACVCGSARALGAVCVGVRARARARVCETTSLCFVWIRVFAVDFAAWPVRLCTERQRINTPGSIAH